MCFTENQRHSNTWEKPLHSLDIALHHPLQLFCVDFQLLRVKMQMFHNPLEKFSLGKSILLEEIWAQLLYMQCWHWTYGRFLSLHLWNMVRKTLWLLLALNFRCFSPVITQTETIKIQHLPSFSSHVILKSLI